MTVLTVCECVQVGVLPVVHGSALVSAGSSQVQSLVPSHISGM